MQPIWQAARFGAFTFRIEILVPKILTMNHVIKFSAFCLCAMALFFSCKKEAQITPLPRKAKTVRAKVIEYGSDLPVAGATLSICTTAFNQNGYYECAGNYLNFTTDANGECFFKTDGVYKFADRSDVVRDGYFSLDEPNSG